MKYIRTKDGQILIAPEIYDGGAMVLCSEPPKYATRNSKNELGCIDCEKVIKTADNIEELCDEFVVEADELGINKHYSHSINETLKDAKQSAKIYKENYNKKQIIYGAVWTKKGLIYVAKMNEEGEFELL